MFLKVFFVVLALTITAAAQPPNYSAIPDKSLPVVVAVSPDGRTTAIARSSTGNSNRYGRVELWNTESGELQRMISGFDGPVWSLTFSRDGQSLMTVSTEYHESKIQASARDREKEKASGELKWWNAQTGEFIRKISVAGDDVQSLEATWSPAGNLVALVEERAELQLTQTSEPGVMNERRMIAGFVTYHETELRILDAQTAQRYIKLEDASRTERRFLGHLFARIESPVFSADGKKVAALIGEEVKIWSIDTGKKIVTLNKLNGWPTAIAISDDGRMVAVASIKGRMPGGETELSVWDATTGKSINKLKGRNDMVACLQFAAKGRVLLIGSLQYLPTGAVGAVKMWDLRDNRLGKLDVESDHTILSLTLVPDLGGVVLRSGSNVELRDAKTWEVRHVFAPTEAEEKDSTRRSRFLLTANRAVGVSFSADGTTVSAEIQGEGTRIWDVRTGGLKDRVPQTEDVDDNSIAARNGGLVAEMQGEAGRIQVLDATTKKEIRAIDAGQKVTALAIDSAGRLLAAARADDSIALWDLQTGALQLELRKHQETINALAFSTDGHTLASGGDDRIVILWDLPSGRARRTLKGHDVTVTSLAFSQDGQILATGTGNAAVVLWDVSSGKLDRILR